MTPYALFAVAWLAPVALIVVAVVAVRRRRGQGFGRWRPAVAAGAVMFMLLSAAAVAGWALPDALDRLPTEDRRAIGPALAASPECGLVPFARVVDVEVRRSADGHVLRYSCGVTPIAWPRFRSEARCVDRTWVGPGLMDQWHGGTCVDALDL